MALMQTAAPVAIVWLLAGVACSKRGQESESAGDWEGRTECPNAEALQCPRGLSRVGSARGLHRQGTVGC